MRARPFAIVFLIWLFVQLANWALNLWLDTYVGPSAVSSAIGSLESSLSYVSGGFGIGFLVGAAIFSVWDWPVLGQLLRHQKSRFRDKAADEVLAQECEEIGRYLYEEAAQIERMRMEKHFQSSVGAMENNDQMHQAWAEARAAESREEERIHRHIGPRVQRTFVQLKTKGLKMDLSGFSLSHYNLIRASYFFAELSDALRNGSYLDKQFVAGRSGANIPERM